MTLLRTLARPAGLPSSRIIFHRPRHDVRSFSLAAVWSSGTLNNAAGYLALVPATVMDSIHSIGLPWYAALPLSAVVIRSLFVYPAMLRPSRKQLTRRANMQPLIDARMSDYRRNLSTLTDLNAIDPRRHWLRLMVQRWRYRFHIETQVFNTMPKFPKLFSFLTLITVSDAVRRLCGAREGLLKILMGPFDWIANAFGEVIPEVKHVVSAYDQTDSASAPAQASDATATSSTDAAAILPTDAAAALPMESPWFEPGLMTEGLPWCTDLTVADPTFILPVMFSGAFFASIYFAPRVYGVAGQATDGPPRATNLQRIGMTIATLSIIPALQMPCALLLYFIANISVNILQARWLAYTMPIRQAPTACKRPVRTQPLKEMKETLTAQRKRT